jgi:hypothetical protein
MLPHHQSNHTDPLLQPGAYLTDGTVLVEVVRVRVAYGPFGPWDAVCVEDCASLQRSEYGADAIRREFRVVRSAPRHPDRMSRAA